ncbi:MAG: 16S rRNA (cytosine(1402)-N(4))-methyltransferase RsmH [Bacteroidales bacterium]|jgi:16S rRNA (cytosine1402-N4)-methyltransferase|nr:16S rRNA (cytosine(1402)-N(4))-methyltransferase RsmH [Bacteroidales bacterium]
MMYHVPALLEESIEGLNIRPEGTYVDVTFGGGGHSKAILERLTSGRLVALDQDSDALANRPDDRRLILEQGNFRFLRNYLAHHGYRKVDGILADLGVSFHHFDAAERGFTFQHDAPLDMRMNASGRITAGDVLNQYPEHQLRMIFSKYGEVPNASRLARQIISARLSGPIERNSGLLEAIQSCIPRGAENKYLAKVFQSLRIEVNRELENLRSLLLQSLDLLTEGGRMAVITYHSLEDRLVKNFFKNGLFEGEAPKDIYGHAEVPFRPVNTKVIVPSDDEVAVNSRSRSAKLRIGERL